MKILTQLFTERQLASGGEKWIAATFLSVGRMPLIPFLPQWKYSNLVCKLSCKVCPVSWEILVLLHICNELKHRCRWYWCSQDATKMCLMLSSGVFCLFLESLLLCKFAILQKGTVTCRSLSGPQPGWRDVCKGKFLWGGKMKTFHVRKTAKEGKLLEERLDLKTGNQGYKNWTVSLISARENFSTLCQISQQLSKENPDTSGNGASALVVLRASSGRFNCCDLKHSCPRCLPCLLTGNYCPRGGCGMC